MTRAVTTGWPLSARTSRRTSVRPCARAQRWVWSNRCSGLTAANEITEYLECLPLLARGKDVQTYQQCVDAFIANGSLVHFLNALQRTLAQTGMDDPGALLTPRYTVDMLLRYQRARIEAGLAPRASVLVFAGSVADADTIAELLTTDGTYTATSVSYKTKGLRKRICVYLCACARANDFLFVGRCGRAAARVRGGQAASACVMQHYQ